MANSIKLITKFLEQLNKDVLSDTISYGAIKTQFAAFLKKNPKALTPSNVEIAVNKVYGTHIKIPSKSGSNEIEIKGLGKLEKGLLVTACLILLGVAELFDYKFPAEMQNIYTKFEAEHKAKAAQFEREKAQEEQRYAQLAQRKAQAEQQLAVHERELKGLQDERQKELERKANLPREIFKDFRESDRYQEVVAMNGTSLRPQPKNPPIGSASHLCSGPQRISIQSEQDDAPGSSRYTQTRPVEPRENSSQFFSAQSRTQAPAFPQGSAMQIVQAGMQRPTVAQPNARPTNHSQMWQQPQPCAQQFVQNPALPEYNSDGLFNWDSLSM